MNTCRMLACVFRTAYVMPISLQSVHAHCNADYLQA